MLFSCELVAASLQDMDEISALESSSFPQDEAASDETIRLRQQVAGHYFVVMKHHHPLDEVIGFINGTCIEEDTITHESMTEHRPHAKTLVIHSVTVSSKYRRNGFGTTMLKKYVDHVKRNCLEIEKILLLSKAYLLRFYVSCGFLLVGLSPVVHGNESWFEMEINLKEKFGEQYQVDAFSNGAFTGNPAAVVFEHREQTWMQSIAMENNLSETAFIKPRADSTTAFDIRWFTPTSEVSLCGHATLASAHALYESGRVSSRDTAIQFFTNSGEVLTAEGKPKELIELNFPATPPSEVTMSQDEVNCVLKGFSIDIKDLLYTGRTLYDIFLEISVTSFIGLSVINFAALAQLEARGVVLTCKGISVEHDFTSRWFGPRCGIDEDPVTGSAHCALAPYWFGKLNSCAIDDGSKRHSLTGYQASARGGVVHVALSDAGRRVLLSGSSLTVMTSKLLV